MAIVRLNKDGRELSGGANPIVSSHFTTPDRRARMRVLWPSMASHGCNKLDMLSGVWTGIH